MLCLLGNVPPNPSELLQSNKTIELIDSLKEVFDIIIIDGPPAGIVTDGVILSNLVDSVILVSTYKQTKMEDLINTKKSIENVGGKIAGVILNKVPIKDSKGYYYE